MFSDLYTECLFVVVELQVEEEQDKTVLKFKKELAS